MEDVELKPKINTNPTMSNKNKAKIGIGIVLAFLAFLLFIVYLSSGGDESANTPCNLSTLTQPTNGSWGTTCQSASGEIPHGTSCDLGCNTGYTLSNQPTCTNSVLSSTTATCTLTSPTLSDHGGGDGGGDESENSPCNLSTLTQPTNGSWGTTCQSAIGEIPHDTSCDLSCNAGYTLSNQPTCTNSVLSSTTATCTLTSSTLSDHGGGDSRGSCVDFDCSSSDNSLNANPDGVTCAGDPCLATECCTVVKTCEEASGEGTFSCGEGLNIKINTPCGSNCNNNTCCDYTCGATLLGDNSIGPITDAICSTHISNSIFRADSTSVNCSEGGCIDSGTIKEADYNNCCTGPPFCSERDSVCNEPGFYPGEHWATARCDTQNCDSPSDKTACCSEWNCRVPTLIDNPGYQVISPGIGRPSEVLYSQVDDLSILCSDGYMPSGSSVPPASVCSADGLNIQLSGCTTGGGVAEVTSVGESPGEWYVGGGGAEQANVNDRKDCNSFCANHNKVCSENTTAEKFSSEINLAEFLRGLNVPPGLQTNYNLVIDSMATDGAVCNGAHPQAYTSAVEESADTGSDIGAIFNIGNNNSCYRKLYSGAEPDDLIPLSCGTGFSSATSERINVCKCREDQ
jgi:hypothetical protein